mmetsp:Transcript_30086/g.44590  ORF Transcript_30086/g.44590 Transcript_30086/m.44590 type:complete len:602 (-) Transcript_30086:262-2067(-)
MPPRHDDPSPAVSPPTASTSSNTLMEEDDDISTASSTLSSSPASSLSLVSISADLNNGSTPTSPTRNGSTSSSSNEDAIPESPQIHDAENGGSSAIMMSMEEEEEDDTATTPLSHETEHERDMNENAVDLFPNSNNSNNESVAAFPRQEQPTASMNPSSIGSAATIPLSPQLPTTNNINSNSNRNSNINININSNSNEENNMNEIMTARSRWIRANQRFQVVITFVALIFSLLLFAILVCWVVLTSSYIISMDKKCDIPLKSYYWFATLQLIFDVFRTDIMKFIFRWDNNSRRRIPVRVLLYNIAYFTYAVLVLKVGTQSVFFTKDSTCHITAPEFFTTSRIFITLSLTAWCTILFGYLIPFLFLAFALSRIGYSSRTDHFQQQQLQMQQLSAHRDRMANINGGGNSAAVEVVLMPGMAAPTGFIDRLRVVKLEEFRDGYPKECCICMGDFTLEEEIIVTQCEHVFHKTCCQEWLLQARTCPVCRTDLPNSINLFTSIDHTSTNTTTTTNDNNANATILEHPSSSLAETTEPNTTNPTNVEDTTIDNNDNQVVLEMEQPQQPQQRRIRRYNADYFRNEISTLLLHLRRYEERFRHRLSRYF